MKLKKLILSSVILSIATYSTLIMAKEEIILSNGEWPPYTSQNLPRGGFFSEIVRVAFDQEGITVKYEYLPWKRAYILTKDGTYKGSLTWAPTKERKKDMIFSDPITLNEKVFFHF